MFDMFRQQVAILGTATACFHRNLGKPVLDTPTPESIDLHTRDADPVLMVLDRGQHSLAFQIGTVIVDKRHRNALWSRRRPLGA